jgi:cytochrome P450
MYLVIIIYMQHQPLLSDHEHDHRNEQHWPNPTQFDSERFNVEDTASIFISVIWC